MKLFYFLFPIILFLAFQSEAQDTIIKCSGEEIKALVTEVNSYDVKYQIFSGKSKKTFSILKREVHKIKYSDNSVDFFNNLNVSKSNKKKENLTQKKTKSKEELIVEKINTTLVSKTKVEEEEEVLEASNKNGLFIIYGVNYVREVALSASNRIGLQAGIGYRFSKSLGVGILGEPNLYIPNGDNSDIIQTNYMIYPALIAKVAPNLYLYGGGGPNTIVTTTINESITKSLFSYQTGMIFKFGRLNIKLGYFNIMKYGVRGVMTVGLCNNLNW